MLQVGYIALITSLGICESAQAGAQRRQQLSLFSLSHL